MQKILQNLQKTKLASGIIANLSFEMRNKLISDIKDAILKNSKEIIAENKKDLKKINNSNPMYDRLFLSENRIMWLIKWCNDLINIKDPLDKFDNENEIFTKDWINIKKIGVPLWVIACIYEARPNVTIDLIIMSIKSWNSIILRWWSQAYYSNNILVKIVKEVLLNNNIDENIIYNYPIERKNLKTLYHAIWLVDVIIPRGWKSLIENVRKQSLVPIIETGAWVVHLYLDNDIKNENFTKAVDIIINAKISRPSVCNALDTLIINSNIDVSILEKMFNKMKKSLINIITDNQDYCKEQLSLNLNIKFVKNIDEAISHIEKYSSSHSDWILSDNIINIEKFCKSINSSVVYANTSTRFSDWWCFGFWWEIGISTQKLHARWPMWAESLVTYKYIVNSDWKIR